MRQRANSGLPESDTRGSDTQKMSAIIADDESLAREELKYLLDQIGDVEVIATAANGLEAVDLIERLEPSIAFLDIQMPGLDGLGVVRRLRERGIDPPQVIFSTAYEQFAVEAFRLEAMDYILKPVERGRLEESVERARRMFNERNVESEPEGTHPLPASLPRPGKTKLLLRAGARNLIVDPADLIFATIDDGVITLVTVQGEGLANFRTLEDLLAVLDPAVFWRAHRSFVVNINRIREVAPWFKSTYQLKMDDKKGTEIPVSRTQSRRLREMLNL